MVRDRLDALARAPGLSPERQGGAQPGVVQPPDVSRVRISSCWAGRPARAQEIADSPFGLEALVFHTHDAEAYERLRAAGLPSIRCRNSAVPLCWTDVKSPRASIPCASPSSPLPGIRMYFCRHLTPECVWSPALMSHPNGARSLRTSMPARPTPMPPRAPGAGRRRDRASWQGRRLGRAAGQSADPCRRGPQAAQPTLSALTLENRDGAHYALDTGL